MQILFLVLCSATQTQVGPQCFAQRRSENGDYLSSLLHKESLWVAGRLRIQLSSASPPAAWQSVKTERIELR